MHKQLSVALTVLKQNINFFKSSMKPDINSIENSLDPESTLFSKQDSSLK